MITIIARMRVSEANAPAYEALLTEVAASTLMNEPGVPYYAWSKSTGEPDSYLVIEVYQNAAAHAAHMASAWVREALPHSLALVDGGFQIEQYVSEGSEAVRLTRKN